MFISGVLFFALSLSPLRAWLIDALPMNLKLGIAAGIGLFLALIGLQAPALIFVACLMAASLGAIKWEDPTEYIPALITALLMPLSYSIATGNGLGFIAYVVLKAFAGRSREVNAAVGVTAAAFLLKLIFA